MSACVSVMSSMGNMSSLDTVLDTSDSGRWNAVGQGTERSSALAPVYTMWFRPLVRLRCGSVRESPDDIEDRRGFAGKIRELGGLEDYRSFVEHGPLCTSAEPERWKSAG